MGRRARREQAKADRRTQGRGATPPRGGLGTNASAATGESQRNGSWWKPKWITDIYGELRRVTWPTRLEIANLTVVVILVSILLGFVLGGFDLFFSWVVEQTLFR
ncbi:MAG TPA: preprotein translocase subunit SecE [Dehalococcoidia bacterium]|jgi:preprotein translocase SecE subunit|nr:preprotein translocase subunit SecE [Dehalococcoidia bacterium]